jgi:hypothetical protein
MLIGTETTLFQRSLLPEGSRRQLHQFGRQWEEMKTDLERAIHDLRLEIHSITGD